jgi:selenocysteine lyase/cysteine desulfurase
MTISDPKKYYSHFLKDHKGNLHFAAHSHHFWPDVTREAHLQYWDDCALYSDEKWNKIFGEVIPKAQKHIASILNLKDSNQITFAPNTHELGTRILSLFYGRSSLSILTTSSEFHSWRRQLQRLTENSSFKVQAVSTSRILKDRRSFLDELIEGLKKSPDIFFISQVFFDSGIALTDDELLELNSACSDKTIMVIDGYHGFAAIPTDLSRLEGKVFYLGGGYKYAQAGEGVGFIVVPKGEWRPAYTGWFAEYGELSRPPGAEVGYTNDGLAFMGATQDPSGLYRFNAVWDLFYEEKISVRNMHEYVLDLQQSFLKGLPEGLLKAYHLTPLYPEKIDWHGHFLTYEAPEERIAKAFQEDLKNVRILVDRRSKRVRFGFGLYQNHTDVMMAANELKTLCQKS